MADAQTPALDHLAKASTAVVALLRQLAAKETQPDDSAQIEAVAQGLDDAVAAVMNPAPVETPPVEAPPAEVPAA